MNMLAQWEDDSNHRQIQFSVEYSIQNSALIIDRLSPTKVTFICPDSNTVIRSVDVHTDKGRQLLADQFSTSGKLDELMIEIGKKHDLILAAD